MFLVLRRQGQTERPRDLADCVKRQWIESTVFSPMDWSVYKQPIRTNKDIEGWYNALNRQAGGQSGLPLYLLIKLWKGRPD